MTTTSVSDPNVASSRSTCQDQPATAPTADEIAAVLHRLGDLTQALAEADPEHKMEVYRALGLRLTYEPETQTVHASVDLGVHRWDSERVRRGIRSPVRSSRARSGC